MTVAPEPDPPMMANREVPLLRGEVAFRLLVESVQDYAIFLLSPEGRILTWNLGAQRIKGYTADEIIGQHVSVFYTAEDRAKHRAETLLATAAELGRTEDETWRVRKDGTRFWADVVLTALRDEDGVTYAYAKVTRDLTARREAEQRERTLLAEQRARAAAEEALLARDQFLRIASHELKTPVASLQLAAEALRRSRAAGRLDAERLTASLDRILNSTRRLGSLVNELLDVSRLTGEQASLVVAQTDVVALTREVIARFVDADEERIRLTSPAELWIEADASRLDQVLTNIIDNALKYSKPPSVVDVELVEADGGVRLTVSDEGIGLDSEGSERIFDAFGRAKNVEHVQGMGLGLYIAQQIVLRHGGRITAATRPTGGAIFEVWLPEGVPMPADGTT